jgi:hypothetical protein
VQGQGPVEGGVAAADDDDVVAGVHVELGDEVDHAAAEPAVAGGQGARAELAHAGGDQHGARAHDAAVGEPDLVLVAVLVEGAGLAVEQVQGVVLAGLGDEFGDEVAAADGGKARDVEDLLLRVHGGDLAAGLRQGVDERGAQAAEAGVVRGEQPGGAGADDQYVTLGGLGHRLPPA